MGKASSNLDNLNGVACLVGFACIFGFIVFMVTLGLIGAVYFVTHL